MKAVVVEQFGGPEMLKYTEVEKPVPAENQVLIRVAATSVNFADIKSRYGTYHGAKQPPFIPGLDAAGTIEEIGGAVKGLKVGQRVIAFPKEGSYAEYVVANEDLVFVLPDSIDFATAAACPIVSFTSYKLLADVARLQPGEIVLIHAAAGGIGTTAIQLAKILGASQVIGTVGNMAKAEVALEAGADHVISYLDEDFPKRVLELTNGKGVDVILDSIAGKTSELSMECLAMYGRLAHFGNASGEVGQFKTKDLHSSCRAVLGFSLGTTRNHRPQYLHATAQEVLKHLEEGRLQIKIGKRFTLEEAAQAQEWVESRQSTGKVVLDVHLS
ncbi:quinone oxidoreductase family protein [Ammoniphilus resinae]|uniref:NADPH2:quinone reductase n=1 Tax=Ammoniphilus resinae TaxID=861532 RepID=A0ABS4GXS8_9BACL|nr:quinone oxidoreductase [Ammoniphilus resinae]MBP1935051.1 NADPH2:quinone reductase [Ammoniphilus resinae]